MSRQTNHHALNNFNPRSPRGERPICSFLAYHPILFQSTLPARGATRAPMLEEYARLFQSTLPARGATIGWVIDKLTREFQSTLPARGATLIDLAYRSGEVFQSTLPARGATDFDELTQFLWEISIHAPREGSDALTPVPDTSHRNFNPRSPRGERRDPYFSGSG